MRLNAHPSSARATTVASRVTTRTTAMHSTVGLQRVMGTSPRVAVRSTSSGNGGGGSAAGDPTTASPPPAPISATTTTTTTTTATASFAAGPALDKAARRFAAGVKAGLSPDEMTAMELAGVSTAADLTEAQRAYVAQVRQKLEARAEELAREDAARRAREARNFELGKMLYERGEYRRCVEALELGVEDAGGKGTQLGGEAAMWLALGYQALGREQECGDLYRWLEQNHPNKRLRKQAADLRYILEAPKLELSPDERVTVPVISSADAWKAGGRRSTVSSSLRKKGGGGGSGGEKKPWERDVTGAEGLLPDAWYVRVAWAAVIVGTGVYGNHVAAQQRAEATAAAREAAEGRAVVGQQQQQQAVESGSSFSSELVARPVAGEAPALGAL